MAGLALPDLAMLWEMKADGATCFGLHLTADEKHVVVHGELEISKITVDGQKEWAFAGRDIVTGDCTLARGSVLVMDFNGERYSVESWKSYCLARPERDQSVVPDGGGCSA